MNEPPSQGTSVGHRTARLRDVLHQPWILPCVMLLAVALRAGVAIRVSQDDFLRMDGGDYREIARQLSAGNGFSISNYRWCEPRPDRPPATHPDLYRPPLLPLVGAPLFLLPGDWLAWAKGMSVVIGLAVVAAIYLLGRNLFSHEVGLLAAAGWSIYPYAVHYSATWCTENLFALTLILGFLCLARYRARPGAWTVVLAGVAFGLGSLARPQGLLFIAAALGWLAVSAAAGRKIRACALLAAGALVVLAPWMIRNDRLTGVPNPGTFYGPYNMWLGMNDRMYDMYRAGESASFSAAMEPLCNEELQAHMARLKEKGAYDVLAANRYWRQQFWSYVMEHPGRAGYILGKRFLHYWRLWPNRAMVSPALFWISLLSVGPLMVLGVIALLRCRRARDPLILLPMVTGLAAGLPFVFHLRFRFPVFDPFLVLLAALAAVHIAGWHREAEKP